MGKEEKHRAKAMAKFQVESTAKTIQKGKFDITLPSFPPKRIIPKKRKKVDI